MFSVPDLITKYQQYTDEELNDIYHNIAGYSRESQEALNVVIEQKGGLERIVTKLKEKEILTKEAERIRKDTEQFGSQGVNSDFIKNVTRSGILPQDKVNEIIDKKFAEVALEIDDKTIKPRTIIGSIIGGGIAAVTGGILLGVFMIQTNRIMYFLIVVAALINYGIIRVSTKQSKKNPAVLISTVVSVIFSFIIAQVLYNTFGNVNQ